MDCGGFSISCLVFLMMAVSKSSAIDCFYCNSANNSACIDIALYQNDIHQQAPIVPVINCEKSVPSPVAANFFCRKIVQTIFHTNRESEVRVTRGCGWIPHHRECYRADNTDHLETVCQCHTDRCNGSESVKKSTVILFSALFASIFSR